LTAHDDQRRFCEGVGSTYRGRVLDPVYGWTTHHSTVELGGKWHRLHHDHQPSGVDNPRGVKVAELTHDSDATVRVTSRGLILHGRTHCAEPCGGMAARRKGGPRHDGPIK
jgi:hypothetical protein